MRKSKLKEGLALATSLGMVVGGLATATVTAATDWETAKLIDVLKVEKEAYERHMDEISQSYKDFDSSKIHYTLTDSNGRLYEPTILDTAEKYHYKYFKLEFTDVDFEAKTLSLNMIIDVLSDVVGTKNSVVIHQAGETSIPVKIN
jgi:hypothetical protein